MDFPTFAIGLESSTVLTHPGRSWPQKTAFSSSSHAEEYKESFTHTKPIKKGNWCHLLQSSSCPQNLRGNYNKDSAKFFLVMAGRGNGHILWVTRFRLDNKKKKCTRRGVETWNRPPREVATSPSTAVIKLWVVKATADLIWCWRESCSRHRVGLQTSWGPFPPSILWDLGAMNKAEVA